MLDEATLDVLRTNREFYAQQCLKVVDERGGLVPLVYRPAQQKLERALTWQRQRGLPERAIVLKSRKTGISTKVQGDHIQDCTLRERVRALTVAQDLDTAGELFEIGETMWRNLPVTIDERLKPPLVSRRNAKSDKHMHFGEPTRYQRETIGNVGVDSRLSIDTASEVDAGRGKTIRRLHASEFAYWPDVRKVIGLFNAVPDQPGTCIIGESTANGFNFFKGFWERAERGEGRFLPVFISWLEDPQCWLAFDDDEERARFEETIGVGYVGEGERELIARGATLEQLHWRRVTVADKAEGNLEWFRQEYPSTPIEAFVGSGRYVFSLAMRQHARDSSEVLDQEGDVGVLQATSEQERHLPNETVLVPSAAAFAPRAATGFGPTHAFWRVWEHPESPLLAHCAACGAVREDYRPDALLGVCPHCGTDAEVRPVLGAGQYIIGVDPAMGDENTNEEGDWSAIEVVSHRTLEQVAEYRSRLEPDLIAREAMLAHLYWNRAWVAVETTGQAPGASIAKDYLVRRFGVGGRVYRRRPPLNRRDQESEVVGWSTDMKTRPKLITNVGQLLREQEGIIRSKALAQEVQTFVRDKSTGKMQADEGAHDDLLFAFMIAEQVAVEKHLAPSPRGGGPVSTMPRTIRWR